ncbi:hypothetical protein D3C72_1924600 [compost metagenome]
MFAARLEGLLAELVGVDPETRQILADATAQLRQRCLPGGIPRIAGDLQHHRCLARRRHEGAAPAWLLQPGGEDLRIGEVLPGVVRQVLLIERHVDKAQGAIVQLAGQPQMLAGERQRQGGDHLIKELALLNVIL